MAKSRTTSKEGTSSTRLGPFSSSRFIPSAPDLPSLTHEDRFTNTELWAREKKGKRNVDRRFVVTASLTICVTN